ncbi:hypothetical protein NBRC116592_12350 [Colwellia sp. KU-HH00111]|uniref:hypothetical protein n=1 Tax=Colwellia sp. KU-HH00111 TaxID=3127652 RepID=UPI003103CC0A
MYIDNKAYYQIKENLEEASFLINKSGEEKRVHNLIMNALINLAKHESSPEESSLSEVNEINKVARRLKLWAKRPEQLNTRILTTYLKLKAREGKVTEHRLKQEVNEDSNFDSNFTQMKIIADRNHGKLFSVENNEVTIWEPVKPHVDKFIKNLGI